MIVISYMFTKVSWTNIGTDSNLVKSLIKSQDRQLLVCVKLVQIPREFNEYLLSHSDFSW